MILLRKRMRVVKGDIRMGKIILAFSLAIIAAGLGFSDEYDEVRELLMAEEGGDIQYLSKINLGIPGGVNWIADREQYAYIYIVDSENKVKLIANIGCVDLTEVRYWDDNTSAYIDLEYDLLQFIPGTQLGNMAAKFGDYNGDGKDEIFIINPYLQLRFSTHEYDIMEKKMVNSFGYAFVFTSAQAPPPLIFTSYRGKEGIMVHTYKFREEGYTWYFFAWNVEAQIYERVTEVSEDEIDFSMVTVLKAREDRQDAGKTATTEPPSIVPPPVVVAVIAVEEQQEETVLTVVEDGGKNGNFVIIIAIVVGVIAVAGAVVFLALRRKKR
jgi:hypothetical protein